MEQEKRDWLHLIITNEGCCLMVNERTNGSYDGYEYMLRFWPTKELPAAEKAARTVADALGYELCRTCE
jgi:hypothetical protein